MPQITIERFFDTHGDIDGLRAWAMKHCSTMQDVWQTVEKPEWMMFIATRPGVLSDTDRRTYDDWTVLRVLDYMEKSTVVSVSDFVMKYRDQVNAEFADYLRKLRPSFIDGVTNADNTQPR